jgi:hypothetical protein
VSKVLKVKMVLLVQ